MKALSIKEPWLSMIVDGKKTIETRTWPVPTCLWNNDLLLVGSKNPKGKYSGKAACIARIVGCHRMQKSEEEAACCEVYPKAYSWLLSDIRQVWPVKIKGQLRLYNVRDDFIRIKEDELIGNLTASERDWLARYGFIEMDDLLIKEE